MNLQDIEAFVAVAETGSVNRAAARLNLTQPATTRRIQNFEAAVGGTPLFDRSVKPAVLTALGGHVLERCRGVLASVAELEACTASASDPTGNLKMGVAHGLGEIVLTTPLDAVRRLFPRLGLQIDSNWTTGLIERVRGGALDCAVGMLTDAHQIPSGLAGLTLGAEQVVIVAASRPRRRPDGKPWRLRDLSAGPWFLNPPGCGCRAGLVKSFDRLQVPIRIGAEIFGEDLQLSLLAHSGGLGLVPRRQFEHSPHRRKLHVLDVVDFNLSATVVLIRGAAPGRFDKVMELLVRELKAKLHHRSKA
jgi:DNA-binding transcriptional LysR family regulator